MSTATLCQVCGTAPAQRSCGRCGAAVCRVHFDERRGLCVDCAAPGGRDAGPRAGGLR